MNTSLHLAVAALVLILGCSCTTSHKEVMTDLSPYSASHINASVSIKDLIAMMPAYSYHECSIEDAQKWLHDAKIERAKIYGIDCETVLYPADGCRGSTRFYLDRKTGSFYEYYYGWEPNSMNIIYDRITEYNVLNERLTIKSQKDLPQKSKIR